MNNPPLIYVVAGEESGDLLGGRLMRAIKHRLGSDVAFAGIGGRSMMEQGLQPLFPMTDLSVMGVTEVLSHLPRLLERLRQTETDILRLKPAVLVTIDAPDFSFRVARRIKARNPSIRLVHYVAPSVWAWRPARARKIAKFLDHLLALLPFEPPWFEREGLACTFVGHPAIEEPPNGDSARFRSRNGIDSETPIVLLLPGSRMGEIERLLPLFIECAQQVQAMTGPLFFAVPTLPHLADHIRGELAGSGLNHAVVENSSGKSDAFSAARAALAASGTIALELGIAGIPTVIAYRMSTTSAFLARRLVKLRYVSLINLVMQREIMPEFLQGEATAVRIVPALARLLPDGADRSNQLKSFESAVAMLRPEGLLPSEKAAEAICSILRDAGVARPDP